MKAPLLLGALLLGWAFPAAAEYFTISENKGWIVEVYSDPESNRMSCDLFRNVDTYRLALEYWTGDETRLTLFMFENEKELFPYEMDIQLSIDGKSPYTFRNANNYGTFILYASTSHKMFWGNLIRDIETGRSLAFLDSAGEPLEPDFPLWGTIEAVADWKKCIRTLPKD